MRVAWLTKLLSTIGGVRRSLLTDPHEHGARRLTQLSNRFNRRTSPPRVENQNQNTSPGLMSSCSNRAEVGAACAAATAAAALLVTSYRRSWGLGNVRAVTRTVSTQTSEARRPDVRDAQTQTDPVPAPVSMPAPISIPIPVRIVPGSLSFSLSPVPSGGASCWPQDEWLDIEMPPDAVATGRASHGV